MSAGAEGTSPAGPQSAAERLAASRASPEHGAAALRAAREAGAHYRRDFADAGYWLEVARARGLTLPQWHQGPTPGRMRSWLRKLGVSVPQYLEWAGEKTLSDVGRTNPSWPLRAVIGLVLEALDSGVLRAEPVATDEVVDDREGPEPEGAPQSDDATPEAGTICCKGCGQPSGVLGDWKQNQVVLTELQTRGYRVLHGGHLPGMSGDPRCIVCAACAATTWRDGLGLMDVEKIHGHTTPTAHQPGSAGRRREET